MAMTTKKILEAYAACKALLPPDAVPARIDPKLDVSIDALRAKGGYRYTLIVNHLAFLCEIGSTYATDNREKSMRWLGFVQGALWIMGAATVEQLKDMNKPDDEAPSLERPENHSDIEIGEGT